MSETKSNVPNLYGLLNLTPLEDDEKAIRLALSKLKKRIETAQASGDIANAKRGAKLLKLGKHHLLDTKRKPQYDAKWQETYGDSENYGDITEAQTELAWNCESLLPYLPSGDPLAEFDLAGFLESEVEATVTDFDAEFERLIRLLDTDSPSDIAAEAFVASSPVIPARAVVAAQPVLAEQISDAGAAANFRPSQTPSQLAKKMRRKRNNSTIMLALGGTVSLVAIIGLILYVLQNGNTGTEPGDGAQLAAANEPVNEPKPRLTAPNGSGLPKVGEASPEDSDNGLDSGSGMDPNNGMEPATGPMDPDPVQPDPAQMDPVQPDPNATTSDPNPMTSTTEPPVTTMPTPAAPVQLTEQERDAWQQTVSAIAQQLSEQQYAAATELISKASPQARSEDQKSQLNRVSRAATLAKEFQSAIVEAIQDFAAGETFVVGNQTEIAFVGFDSQVVTFKIFGRNQTYRLTNLRMGIAQSLAKFKMDLTHPNSKAMQASFMRFHSAVPDQQVARALMREAIDAGVIGAEMEILFDDKFE